MPNNILIALRRSGNINPLCINEFEAAGGFEGLRKALHLSHEEVRLEIEKSGLRGRGGAGFSSGVKQRFTAANNEAPLKYVVCNADEGEPGTYKDRFIMETDPFALIEGMLIAAYGIGASYGYIYLRGEYGESIEKMNNAITEARKKNYLGYNILGSGFSFDIELFLGAGSYLCGEELTLLESLEGKRGYPRIKPPFPAEKGLWGKPTLVNNVETFVHMPFIIEKGYQFYAAMGTAESKGSKIFCVSGHVNKTGIFELPMGVTLRELINDYCGGMKDAYTFKGALLGGAAGTFVDETVLDTPLAYETLKSIGATLGSGAVIIVDDKTDMYKLMLSILEFFKHESCGKCVPCRIGTALLLNDWLKKDLTKARLLSMQAEAEYMARTSLCPLGQSPILPVKSFIKYFKDSL